MLKLQKHASTPCRQPFIGKCIWRIICYKCQQQNMQHLRYFYIIKIALSAKKQKNNVAAIS